MATKLWFTYAVGQVVEKNTLISSFLGIICKNIGTADAMKGSNLRAGSLLVAQFVKI